MERIVAENLAKGVISHNGLIQLDKSEISDYLTNLDVPEEKYVVHQIPEKDVYLKQSNGNDIDEIVIFSIEKVIRNHILNPNINHDLNINPLSVFQHDGLKLDFLWNHIINDSIINNSEPYSLICSQKTMPPNKTDELGPTIYSESKPIIIIPNVSDSSVVSEIFAWEQKNITYSKERFYFGLIPWKRKISQGQYENRHNFMIM